MNPDEPRATDVLADLRRQRDEKQRAAWNARDPGEADRLGRELHALDVQINIAQVTNRARLYHEQRQDAATAERKASEAARVEASTRPTPHTDRYRELATTDPTAAALYRSMNSMAIAAEQDSEPDPPLAA